MFIYFRKYCQLRFLDTWNQDYPELIEHPLSF